MAIIDLKNKKFGRLTVLSYAGVDKHHQALWLCQCDCGTKKVISGAPLRNGTVVSCGCYNKEIRMAKHTKHNMAHSRVYRIWQNIKSRCYRKNHKAYAYYGGRGITMCDEWLNDPSAFISWALSNGYADNLTIDRINNDGNYEPSNCRWITHKDQMNNRNVCKFFTIDGETHSLTEWCEIYNVPNERTRNRVINEGWDLLTAIAVPPLTRTVLPIIDF